MMSLVRSFILMVLFATNGAAQTSPLDLLLQQQSQGLPFGTDMQSLENICPGRVLTLTQKMLRARPNSRNPE
jgi:hypothetical protein